MSPSSHRIPLVLAMLGLVVTGYFLLGLWADFPYFYHTDEPGKARQIIENTRNLHHPLLMLESTALAVKSLGVPAEAQAVTETGRALSALFCALAAALLAATVARAHGIIAGVLAGAVLLVQPDVQEYARYFKEDPSLMFGWACVFAAMGLVEAKPTATRAAALGAAVAIAASGKYVGVVMLLPAAWVLVRAMQKSRSADKSGSPSPSWQGLIHTAIMAMALTFILINHRLLLDQATFKASLARETTLVLEGQGSVSKSIPHAGFFKRLLGRSVHLLPFVAIGWWAAWRNRKTWGFTALALLVSPWALALLLAFSAKDSGRYFMPANLGLAAAAAIGVVTLAGWIRRPGLQQLAMGCFAVILLGASFARSWAFIDGFRSDARRELLEWINTNLPPGSVVMQGRKVSLPDSSGKFADAWHVGLSPGIRLDSVNLLADKADTPAALAAAGITHVALAGDEFEVYLAPHKAKPGQQETRDRRRAFYLRLFADGTLVWQRAPGKIGTHQPELRLYRLPATPSP